MEACSRISIIDKENYYILLRGNYAFDLPLITDY